MYSVFRVVAALYLDVFLCTLQQSQCGQLVREGHVLSQHLQTISQLSPPGGRRGWGGGGEGEGEGERK